MNQKYILNALLLMVIVISIALSGFLVYATFIQKPPTVANQTTTIPTNQNQTSVQNSHPVLTPTASPETSSEKMGSEGIKGNVIISGCAGTRPANPPPGYQPCGQGPAQLLVLNITNNVSGIKTQATTDKQGNFQIALPPGTYSIDNQFNNPMRYPYLEGGPYIVEVKPGAFTTVQLKFTSGGV